MSRPLDPIQLVLPYHQKSGPSFWPLACKTTSPNPSPWLQKGSILPSNQIGRLTSFSTTIRSSRSSFWQSFERSRQLAKLWSIAEEPRNWRSWLVVTIFKLVTPAQLTWRNKTKLWIHWICWICHTWTQPTHPHSNQAQISMRHQSWFQITAGPNDRSRSMTVSW